MQVVQAVEGRLHLLQRYRQRLFRQPLVRHDVAGARPVTLPCGSRVQEIRTYAGAQMKQCSTHL